MLHVRKTIYCCYRVYKTTIDTYILFFICWSKQNIGLSIKAIFFFNTSTMLWLANLFLNITFFRFKVTAKLWIKLMFYKKLFFFFVKLSIKTKNIILKLRFACNNRHFGNIWTHCNQLNFQNSNLLMHLNIFLTNYILLNHFTYTLST